MDETNKLGHPKIEVDVNEVLSLQSLNYSWTKISEILGISRCTLYRRLREAGIDTNDYATLTPSELDNLIKEIKLDFPNDGEVMMKSHLLRLGIKVTRQALRDSIH